MANFTRIAKSARDWTENELRAYNIKIVEQSLAEFFGRDQLPPVPTSLFEFTKIIDRSLAPDDETYKLLHHLDLAHHPKTGQEANVDVFVARLLETLGYASGRRVILDHQTLPFMICGAQCSALADVCIFDENNDLLLPILKEDERFDFLVDPQPPLIATAIAAYQRNNFNRNRVLHVPTLDELIVPGIAIIGTTPTFYKITVTEELSQAVIAGAYPPNPVVVYRHTPRLPWRTDKGMKPLENRIAILQYYEAFKTFV